MNRWMRLNIIKLLNTKTYTILESVNTIYASKNFLSPSAIFN